jgi:hypothetical protein
MLPTYQNESQAFILGIYDQSSHTINLGYVLILNFFKMKQCKKDISLQFYALVQRRSCDFYNYFCSG